MNYVPSTNFTYTIFDQMMVLNDDTDSLFKKSVDQKK